MKLKKTAFTLIELLVVLAITAFVAAILLPALAATRTKSLRINCLNNLKQVGLAARLWQEDNYGSYPMAVSRVFGGASEYLAHESTTGSGAPMIPTASFLPGLAFLVMSNELSTAKILWCPSDNIHTINAGYATNMSYQDLLDIQAPVGTTGTATGPQPGEITTGTPPNGSKISYFVNADAVAGNPQDILTGDDNIGNNGAGASTPARYRYGGNTVNEYCVTASPATCEGITTAAFGPATYWSWTANDFHQSAGNLAFADGGCQQATIPGLHYYLNHSTNEGAEAINFMP